MSQAPESLMTLLGRGVGSQLIEESMRQIALKRLIIEALPANLHPHLEACALRNGTLILDWRSAAAANLGRFHAQALITALRARGTPGVREAKMRSRPPSTPAPAPRLPRQIPGTNVIAHIKSLTQHMDADELRDALIHLSETLQKKRRRP